MQTLAWEYKTKIVRDGRSQRYLNYEKQIKTEKKKKSLSLYLAAQALLAFSSMYDYKLGLKENPLKIRG